MIAQVGGRWPLISVPLSAGEAMETCAVIHAVRFLLISQTTISLD